MQTGACSYATPELSDGGNVMLYLSDRPAGGSDEDDKDVTNTRVAVSVKSGTQFPVGIRLEGQDDEPQGYGDSALKVSGNKNFAAAAWVRQMENITLENVADGGTLSEGQQFQTNSAEIVVGIYNGTRGQIVTFLYRFSNQ